MRLVRICDLVAALVLFVCASMRKAFLSCNISEVQKYFGYLKYLFNERIFDSKHKGFQSFVHVTSVLRNEPTNQKILQKL